MHVREETHLIPQAILSLLAQIKGLLREDHIRRITKLINLSAVLWLTVTFSFNDISVYSKLRDSR